MAGRTIYVVCPDEDEPSGGHKKLYRHVDLLNRMGRPALALHDQEGFRYQWFANQTPVAGAGSVSVSPGDFVVIPEIYGPATANLWPGVPKIIFNQNAYLTFVGYSLDQHELDAPYLNPDVVATIVVSEDSLSYLRYAFPDHPFYLARYSVDPEIFSYSASKKRQLCLMTRRNLPDAIQVINILKFRDALAGYEVVALHGLTEVETAEALRQSRIFLSFSSAEGFGLPPAEAMACGCITIGYHGRAGREYFRPEFSFPVELGDIDGYARTVECVIRELDSNASFFQGMARAAASYIGEHYSPRAEAESIRRCWDAITAT